MLFLYLYTFIAQTRDAEMITPGPAGMGWDDGGPLWHVPCNQQVPWPTTCRSPAGNRDGHVARNTLKGVWAWLRYSRYWIFVRTISQMETLYEIYERKQQCDN